MEVKARAPPLYLAKAAKAAGHKRPRPGPATGAIGLDVPWTVPTAGAYVGNKDVGGKGAAGGKDGAGGKGVGGKGVGGEVVGGPGRGGVAAPPLNEADERARHELPVWAGRAELLRELELNDTLIVMAETGSGKTTQIPQFLHEAGYTARGVIAITQPRRVAAITIAQRVAREMGCPLGGLVGYSVRFDDMTDRRLTKLKYITDGMLVREAIADPMLSAYGAVILDEAHERSVQTDVLCAIVKSAQAARREALAAVRAGGKGGGGGGGGKRGPPPNALKVVVMSATLEMSVFSDFFSMAPCVHVRGRSFPVTCLYALSPLSDYVEAAVTATLQVHCEEAGFALDAPSDTQAGAGGDGADGDILVFLTGTFFFARRRSRRVRGCYTSAQSCCRRTQLLLLGALDVNGALTKAGRQMSQMPLDPPYARALLAAAEHGCVGPMLSLAAIVSVDGALFVGGGAARAGGGGGKDGEDGGAAAQHSATDAARARFASQYGDLVTRVHVLVAAHAARYDGEWCRAHGLNKRTLASAQRVRKQLCGLWACAVGPLTPAEREPEPLDDDARVGLRRALTAGFFMRAAVRQTSGKYLALASHEEVAVHPSSVLFARKVSLRSPDLRSRESKYRSCCRASSLISASPLPPLSPSSVLFARKVPCVLFQELVLTNKRYIRELTAIDESWLSELAPDCYAATGGDVE
ncbi:hypothetical protein T492DRAFT_1147846 [Pavlovales sp. CCMP2436]|nr:hypothetical protein T492DRAFT_1147846 [Pavlovales sp. CCMP2436]